MSRCAGRDCALAPSWSATRLRVLRPSVWNATCDATRHRRPLRYSSLRPLVLVIESRPYGRNRDAVIVRKPLVRRAVLVDSQNVGIASGAPTEFVAIPAPLQSPAPDTLFTSAWVPLSVAPQPTTSLVGLRVGTSALPAVSPADAPTTRPGRRCRRTSRRVVMR